MKSKPSQRAMNADRDSRAPNLPSPEWIGDGKSRETAILFTNANSQLEHIGMQRHFVGNRGIARGSVEGEQGFIYDVWTTTEGEELWFKVPVSPPEEFMREMERAIKVRQSSYAEFEARLNKRLADDQHQEESSRETTVPWKGELREPILQGITWGIEKADLRAIYKGLLYDVRAIAKSLGPDLREIYKGPEPVPDCLQDLEMPIHGHMAAGGFFFGSQGLHMVAASLHFGVGEKRLSQKDVLSKSDRVLAELKELYGEPWIAVPYEGQTFNYMWRSQETLIQFAWNGGGGWGVHYRSTSLDEFAR